jgi:DNA-binding MurR/RpiR family transcriptional regulator
MSTRLTLRIQERFEKLSPAEQRLASLLLDRKDDLLTYSATQLAQMASVSKATAARLFQSLGYADFNEVRAQAREERNRTEPYRYSAVASEALVSGGSIGAHLEAERRNLTRTLEDIRSDRLEEAAQILKDAPRVWTLGFGAEEGLARHMRVLMARLRHDVNQIGLTQGAWAEDLAMMGPRDALILVTMRPRPRVLKPILEFAKTTRVAILTLTDPLNALTAQRYARVVFPCHVEAAAYGPSYTSVMSVLRLLALAYAARAGKRAMERAATIADIHEELDDTE